MNRPIPPLFFVGVFLIILVAAVLMLSTVIGHQDVATANSTPREALNLQLELLKEGNAVGLRLTFPESLRPSITAEMVATAKAKFQSTTLDALVGTIETGKTEKGIATARVLTPEGQPLTVLVLADGEWRAEDLWFLNDR